jgi:hypothetical protein
MTKLPALLPTLALLGMVSHQAYAQTPSADGAKALETQITQWLKQVTAGAVPLPDRPVQFAPEGDHYLMSVPLAPLAKVEPADAAITAKVRPLDGTKWAIDDEQFPADLKFSTTEMVANPPDDKDPDAPVGTHSETVTYQMKLGAQTSHRVFDPTYTSPTNSTGSVASVDLVKTGGMGASITHMGHTTAQGSSQPTDPTHVDVLGDVTSEGYATKTVLPSGESVDMSADRIHIVSALSGVAYGKVIPLVHMVMESAKSAEARHKATKPGDKADDTKLTETDKAELHAMLVAAQGLFTGAKFNETVEGIKFAYAGQSAGIGKLEMTMGGDAPQGLLSANIGLSIDGLTIPDLPPNLAAYIPSHLAIHPTVSNISLTDLTKMGLDATAPLAPGAKPPTPDAALEKLFSHGGINVGFDTLDLDVGSTKFSGTGKFNMTGPQTVTGQAEITARGLDALITQAQSDPMLAQAIPVVIFLKGIAKTNADQSVWQITVSNAKLLVNGVDLSALAKGMK